MGDALKLYNTLTREKQAFEPIDPNNVRMYVCGPTVYDFAHIGNARPVIVFDVLYRLLRHLYGEDHVTYVRNITDVDDKINARAKRDYPDLPLNEAIRAVTEKTADQFHKDIEALGVLPPSVEPRATDHIDGMVSMIQTLIDKGNAYVAEGPEGEEVLFDVPSMPDYGALSRRNLDDQQAGARIAVESHKKSPADFVLWKESDADEPGWEGTFSVDGKTVAIHGRPGWHIECSVMSEKHLGETFDIHGGGLDLIFPHHENEIAQSCCAHGNHAMANVWMHNGFVQVEGRKMSKSEGNFVTIRDNLRGIFPGWDEKGQVPGMAMRLAMLGTHYRQPLDWTKQKQEEALQKIRTWYTRLANWQDENWQDFEESGFLSLRNAQPIQGTVEALCNDLDIHTAIQIIDHGFEHDEEIGAAASSMNLLGLLHESSLSAFASFSSQLVAGKSNDEIYWLAAEVGIATANNDPQFVSDFTDKIYRQGMSIARRGPAHYDIKLIDEAQGLNIDDKIAERLAFIRDKNWAEADRIRDELASQGIQLKDSKDKETGERITTWEVKR